MKKKSTVKDEVLEKVSDDVVKSNMQKNILVMLVFSVFIAIFALLNSEIVPVNLIFVELNLSAALVILISATIGAVIIYSFDAIVIYKLRKKIKSLQNITEGDPEKTVDPQSEDFSVVEQEKLDSETNSEEKVD